MMRRTNPFDDFEELFERMSRQFDEMGRQFDRSGMMAQVRHEMAIDVTDHDGEIVVTIDLPGYEKEDISLSVANRTLTVDATRELDEERADGEYLRRERRHESARRTIRLPESVDEDGASAGYHNGVLTVTLPKRDVEPDDSRRIDID
ncbi:Hsp20/alpha crystallin family protein [Haloferax sp. Atlit-10N]|uniref:Hsp20-type molecular chaperone n=1 Tax=Haloferax prahovense (strain DSM 18310 / JCM 13924 / TL6) TaxID=1227461 RepID=M0GMI1_HALPT|nr:MULTISPECIES: archaeal heat shock protein Hsp14 [Haloferax]ELZ72788.1 hsp20-type molecular chaperone [Haloferax prahovense DSM 18310]RDZ43989.1 Hsp20/alpha crystallin family protein [Haloferax sp. Atlit-19N]RDZ46237.1 Hsp20/alpha crystallin family protein [Haloferax sp. Atlit-16N]RDZ60070.1 Hsp20/alpha crystallin family protein [Haloferax sp. Atlit-10N]